MLQLGAKTQLTPTTLLTVAMTHGEMHEMRPVIVLTPESVTFPLPSSGNRCLPP